MIRRLTICIALGLAVLLGVPAEAADEEDITFSIEDRKIEKFYPGIPGSLRYVLITPELWTPTICAEAEYCDVIELTLNLPAAIKDIWGLNITVSWPLKDREDYDIWLYDKDEAEVSSSYVGGGTSEDIKLVEPEQRFFYLVVIHYSGPGLDNYKVTIEYTVAEFEEYGSPFRRGGADDSLPPREKTPGRPAGASAPEAPEPGEPRVKVPGPDGDPAEFTLPVVATMGQSTRADEGSGVLWFVLGGVLLVGSAAGTVLFLKRRSAVKAF